MRITIWVGALIMSGCAGQPSTPEAPPTRYVSASGQAQPTASEGDLNAKRIAEAKKQGYTLTNTNGEALFCRSDFKTGSHVERNTTCLTAAELDSLHDETRQSLRNYERPIPFDPRLGH
jgi:hypothetical protein